VASAVRLGYVARVTTLRSPLSGVRVLDMTRVVSGPVVGRALADLGADVVKLEPPEGDVTRLWGEARHGIAGFFLQQNAGKRNLCVDLKAPGAAALVHELAGVVDVLVENFRPGVLERLGVTWEALSTRNPRLVMASISGFGQEGPHAHRPAYASVIHAESGVIGRLMALDRRTPTDPVVSFADYDAGLHATIAILAALLQARATGVGDRIDIAMLDAMLGTDDYIHHAIDASSIRRLSGEYWKLADGGYVIIPGYLHHVFKRLADLYGLADGVAADASLEEKTAARRAAIAAFLASFDDRAAVFTVLDQAGLPWGELKSPEEAIASPTARHRGTVAVVDDGAGGTRGVVQLPYRFRHSESGVRGRSAALGEHNAEVLHEWLGLDGAAIERLASAGVLRTS
jgi:crotonobetainyl-CoA:carnitine CoA-transferase CaiB-like acyl-CoA transferase